jgi:carboxymethylenebutenolidase
VQLRAALERAQVAYEWHEVNAQHAFLRDEGPRFDPQLARWGLDTTLALFARRLG